VITPGSLRFKELFVQLEQVGLNAIPICALITFLIGIVIAYLTGVQLEYYGANIFIVDGVSIAMCRELSPILVAIVVAGRSGSAFTAQLGTMKLNEEIDALQVLGLSPVRVLVMPRIIALMVSLPLLVFFGDIFGILGGILVADFRLGVTGATFIQRIQAVLEMKHVIVGLIKAPVFAYFIAIIGCRMGLNVEKNAKSVGVSTTRTVVRSIVAVILLNAAFAVLLSELGI
jgi:phospholipid/cholesterol/gamma-HCH transport system permease protein